MLVCAAARHVCAQPSRAAAFTFLNPHVYLDTLWLVGTVGAQQAPAARPAFVAGGAAASLAWFSALGWGARWLSPWFARRGAWRLLESGGRSDGGNLRSAERRAQSAEGP